MASGAFGLLGGRGSRVGRGPMPRVLVVLRMRGGQIGSGFRSKNPATDMITGATVAGGLAQVMRPGLMELGAKHGPSIAAGQWWRLFTPMLLHGGVVHLGCNLFSLRNVGPALESWYGPGRTIGVYVFAGACGNVASTMAGLGGFSVGASGAVAGLVGALAVHYARHQNIMGPQSQRVLQNIGQVVALNAFLGLALPSIDNFAHLGGLVGGATAGYFIGCRYLPVRDRLGRLRGYKDKPIISF